MNEKSNGPPSGLEYCAQPVVRVTPSLPSRPRKGVLALGRPPGGPPTLVLAGLTGVTTLIICAKMLHDFAVIVRSLADVVRDVCSAACAEVRVPTGLVLLVLAFAYLAGRRRR